MALAILKYEGHSGGRVSFLADIGTNSVYKYVIGENKKMVNGHPFVDDVAIESEIFESQTLSAFDTSFSLEIAEGMFDNNKRYVQLQSYKDSSGKSSAFSDVIEVLLLSNDIEVSPQLTFSKSKTNMNYTAHANCRSVSCNYIKAPISRSLFWDMILDATGATAPSVDSVIGDIIKNNSSKHENGIDPGVLNMIKRILEALQQTEPITLANPSSKLSNLNASTQTTKSFSTSISYKQLSSIKSRKKLVKKPFGRGMIVDGGLISGPLLASIAGPLLSSFLGPVIQQAPQLLQTILDNPIKLFNAIAERKLAERQLEQGYIERLTADVNQRALMEQLIRSGIIKQSTPVSLSFSASKKFSIEFIQTDPLNVMGHPKFVYQPKAGIKLKLRTNNNSNQASKLYIPKVIIQLLIKDSVTMELLYEKKFKMKEVAIGAELELVLTPEELLSIPRNKDLLLGANFIWKSKENSMDVGTYNNHFIFLTDNYVLKDMGSTISEENPLIDVSAFRFFWHKVW
jgi:hypothetical protein